MPQVQTISNPQGVFGYQAQAGYEVEEFVSLGAATTDGALTASSNTLNSSVAAFGPDDIGSVIVFTTFPSTSAPFITTITGTANSTVVNLRDNSTATVTGLSFIRQLIPGMPVIQFSTGVLVGNTSFQAPLSASSQAASASTNPWIRGVTAQLISSSSQAATLVGVVLSKEAPGTYSLGGVATTVSGANLTAPQGGTVRVITFGHMPGASSGGVFPVGSYGGAVPGLRVTSTVLGASTAIAMGAQLTFSSLHTGAASPTTALLGSAGTVIGTLASTVAQNTTMAAPNMGAYISLR